MYIFVTSCYYDPTKFENLEQVNVLRQKQESIPVGYVLPAFMIRGGGEGTVPVGHGPRGYSSGGMVPSGYGPKGIVLRSVVPGWYSPRRVQSLGYVSGGGMVMGCDPVGMVMGVRL